MSTQLPIRPRSELTLAKKYVIRARAFFPTNDQRVHCPITVEHMFPWISTMSHGYNVPDRVMNDEYTRAIGNICHPDYPTTTFIQVLFLTAEDCLVWGKDVDSDEEDSITVSSIKTCLKRYDFCHRLINDINARMNEPNTAEADTTPLDG